MRFESNNHDGEPITIIRVHIQTDPNDPAFMVRSGDNLCGVLKTTFVSALQTYLPRWP